MPKPDLKEFRDDMVAATRRSPSTPNRASRSPAILEFGRFTSVSGPVAPVVTVNGPDLATVDSHDHPGEGFVPEGVNPA